MTDMGSGVDKRDLPSRTPPPRSVTWKIPMLPVSMNKLYAVNFRTRSVYMTNEARDFKSKMKLFITPYTVTSNDKIMINLHIHRNWYYKNKNMIKSDIQNLVKVMIDAVAERLGFDDCQVWSMTCNKIQSTVECCYITMGVVNEEKREEGVEESAGVGKKD